MNKWLPTASAICAFVASVVVLWWVHGSGLLDTMPAISLGIASAVILTAIAVPTTISIQARQRQRAEWEHRYATEANGLHDALSYVYKAIENRGTYPITKVSVDGQERYKYTTRGFNSDTLASVYGKETFHLLDKDTRTNITDVIEAAAEHYRYLGKVEELTWGRNFEDNRLPNEKIGEVLDCYKMICHYEKFMKTRIPKIVEALKRPLPDSLWDAIYVEKSHDRLGPNYASEDGSLRVETTWPKFPPLGEPTSARTPEDSLWDNP